MVLNFFLKKQLSINSDIFIVLHELMYVPSGLIKLTEFRKLRSSIFCHDIKWLLMFCHEHAYVEFNGESVQLTEVGLQFYLKQKHHRANSMVDSL
ncbi:hypothetical protein DZ860_19260 [Vibrio sinensis]|uniref:Uncharacterized protein n=1 Tax=Vibrio sinensis TaxID=2302434 RepID=A0A3A6QD03_9VIBR|nr:hypothetical protein DZ860_19260 [Vibrio sinensis]